VIRHNGGFAVFDRLKISTGGAELNNLFSSIRRVRDVHVDFLSHVLSLGAEGEGLCPRWQNLPQALARARASDRSYGLVMPVQAYTWLEGSAGWDVGIPEVSERIDVQVARGLQESEKRTRGSREVTAALVRSGS